MKIFVIGVFHNISKDMGGDKMATGLVADELKPQVEKLILENLIGKCAIILEGYSGVFSEGHPKYDEALEQLSIHSAVSPLRDKKPVLFGCDPRRTGKNQKELRHSHGELTELYVFANKWTKIINPPKDYEEALAMIRSDSLRFEIKLRPSPRLKRIAKKAYNQLQDTDASFIAKAKELSANFDSCVIVVGGSHVEDIHKKTGWNFARMDVGTVSLYDFVMGYIVHRNIARSIAEY